MAALELPGLRRAAYGVVLAQVVTTAVLAAICYVPWGPKAALSAAIGGGIGTVASLTLAMVVFRKEARPLEQLMRAFYLGEAAKIGVTIVLFVVVLVTMKTRLVPGALFGAFAATFLVHWMILPRAMRRLDVEQLGQLAGRKGTGGTPTDHG